MSIQKGQKMKNISLRSLERYLKRFGQPEMPKGLEDKLLAAIPMEKPITVKIAMSGFGQKIRNLSASAAAVILMLASVLMINYASPSPSRVFSREIEDTSLCVKMYGQNSFLGGRESSLLEASWSPINHNEPLF